MPVIDQDVDELLHSVCAADSAQDVQRLGSVLVQRLQMARQRRCDITAEEMKAVMEERDSSAAKVSPMVHTSTEVRGHPGCDVIVFCQEGHNWTGLPSFQTLSSAHAGSTTVWVLIVAPSFSLKMLSELQSNAGVCEVKPIHTLNMHFKTSNHGNGTAAC